MKTDAQLQKDVMDEIRWEPSTTAARIGVTAAGGVVTLTGVVATYAEKWAARADRRGDRRGGRQRPQVARLGAGGHPGRRG